MDGNEKRDGKGREGKERKIEGKHGKARKSLGRGRDQAGAWVLYEVKSVVR